VAASDLSSEGLIALHLSGIDGIGASGGHHERPELRLDILAASFPPRADCDVCDRYILRGGGVVEVNDVGADVLVSRL